VSVCLVVIQLGSDALMISVGCFFASLEDSFESFYGQLCAVESIR
jgi:hypothetical protein